MGAILNKKYRIIHADGKMIIPFEEMPESANTYVGDNLKYFETDSFEEAEQYVKDNNLECN